MKNLILTLFIASLSLTSCTPNDPATPSSAMSGVVPTKIVSTYSSGEVFTSVFTYSGNKILEENIVGSTELSRRKYTYTGDLITKIQYFMGSAYSAWGGEILTYENGKVKTTIEIPYPGNNGELRKETYVYNTDGTVTSTSSSINQTTGVESANGGQMRYIYNAGFLIKTESISNGVVGQVTNYTNDIGKNQAFKNVTGFDQTLAQGNLRLSATYIGNPGANQTFSYLYNANNYPTQVVEPNIYNNISKTQVFTY